MLVGTLALVLLDFLLLNLGAKDTSRNLMIPLLPEQENGHLHEIQETTNGVWSGSPASMQSFMLLLLSNESKGIKKILISLCLS